MSNIPQYYDFHFQVNGTEKQFFQGLADFLHTLDPKIVCTSDLDVEFSDSDLTHVPQIDFVIDGKLPFYFRRTDIRGYGYDSNLTIGTSKYKAVCKNTGVNLDYYDNAATLHYTDVANRWWFISALVGENFTYFSINTTQRGGDNQPMNDNLSIAYCYGEDACYYAYNTNINRRQASTMFNLSGRTFKRTDDLLYGGFTSRFSYAAQPGKIDYVKSSVYTTNGTRLFTTNSIYDCTTVNVCDTVSLSDGVCYAIGPHQLVKIPDNN